MGECGVAKDAETAKHTKSRRSWSSGEKLDFLLRGVNRNQDKRERRLVERIGGWAKEGHKPGFRCSAFRGSRGKETREGRMVSEESRWKGGRRRKEQEDETVEEVKCFRVEFFKVWFSTSSISSNLVSC